MILSANILAFHVVQFRLKMICYQIFLSHKKSDSNRTKKTILHSGCEEDWEFRNVFFLSPLFIV